MFIHHRNPSLVMVIENQHHIARVATPFSRFPIFQPYDRSALPLRQYPNLYVPCRMSLSCPSIFYSAVFCDLFLCFWATSFVFFLGVRGSAFLPTHQTFQLYDAMTYVSLPAIIILIDWTPHSINIMMSTTGATCSSLVSVVFKPEKPEIRQMDAPRRRTIGQIPCQALGKEYDTGGGSMAR